jgi:hypothetical protein
MEGQLLCPCEFQLVLVYNQEPGESVAREVEPEVLAEIFLDLRKRFGNFTPLGRTGTEDVPAGEWEGLAEPSIRIEVAVLPERVPEVERFVHDVGLRLINRKPCTSKPDRQA